MRSLLLFGSAALASIVLSAWKTSRSKQKPSPLHRFPYHAPPTSVVILNPRNGFHLGTHQRPPVAPQLLFLLGDFIPGMYIVGRDKKGINYSKLLSSAS